MSSLFGIMVHIGLLRKEDELSAASLLSKNPAELFGLIKKHSKRKEYLELIKVSEFCLEQYPNLHRLHANICIDTSHAYFSLGDTKNAMKSYWIAIRAIMTVDGLATAGNHVSNQVTGILGNILDEKYKEFLKSNLLYPEPYDMWT
jgi:hypothetical protein